MFLEAAHLHRRPLLMCMQHYVTNFFLVLLIKGPKTLHWVRLGVFWGFGGGLRMVLGLHEGIAAQLQMEVSAFMNMRV